MPKILHRFVCTSFSVLALTACGGSGANEMSENETKALSALSSEAVLVLSCSGCHSQTNGAIASLATYSEDAMRETLLRYKAEADGTTVMHRLARGYTDIEIELISKQLGHSEPSP